MANPRNYPDFPDGEADIPRAVLALRDAVSEDVDSLGVNGALDDSNLETQDPTQGGMPSTLRVVLNRIWAPLADATAFGKSLLLATNAAALRSLAALGNSATRNVGTSAGSVAAGDDSRFSALGTQGPQGAPGNPGTPGSPGAAATVAIGSVATGAAGSGATVANSGTSSAAVLDFSIPRGNQGTQGIQGIQGIQGNPGTPGAKGDTGDFASQFQINEAASMNVNWNNASAQFVTLTANRTIAAFQNPVLGATYTIAIFQDATGGRQITWTPAITWLGTGTGALTAGANRVNIATLQYINGSYVGSIA